MKVASRFARPSTFFAFALTAACGLALAACSSGSSTGAGAGGSHGSGTGGTAAGTGGATATGGANGTGGGSPGSGGSAPGTGGTVTTGSGGSATGSGATTGAGGTQGSAGTNGAAGSTAGGHTGGTTGGGGGAPGSSSGFCPSGAIFCADFEEASGVPSNAPVGTATFADPSEYGKMFSGANAVMALDTTAPYAGAQSLKVDPSSGFSVRTLSVTVPQTFWVRLYIKSDKAIGQPDHNSFFGAGLDPDYSKGKFVELSEQFNCILLNQSDALYPAGTTCGANTALTANDWHCMAAQFDGATGNVQVFSGTTKIIDAVAWAPAKQAFTTFSFGYFAYNANSATVWYDNVVVSASPLSCP